MISRIQYQRLCCARRRLRDSAAAAWPLEKIAAEAGLSRYQFIRRFAALFGETPHRYRQRHRLELAREMLLLGGDSVTDVCLSVGFTSLGSFSSLFKRHYGEPPSSFRRRASDTSRLQHQPGCLTLMQQAWRVR